MKKVYNVFKSIGEWLAKAGADRYLHLLAGLVIAFFTAMLMHGAAGEGRWTCAGFALMVTVVVGILKEVADQTYEGESDAATITEHVKNIRRKLLVFGVNPVETVWGIGYRWV